MISRLMKIYNCKIVYHGQNMKINCHENKQVYSIRIEPHLFLPYTNNKGADQPAHPRSLVSTFVVRCLDSIISILIKPKISRLASLCS